MKSNYTHFFQVNDDLNIMGSGWLTAYADALEHIGALIAYPYDLKKFGCSLPCQAFVDSRHYRDLGFLFPPEIRDWHGDTFLGLYYAGQSYCDRAFKGCNGRPSKKQ
jgi:hypothetical protein